MKATNSAPVQGAPADVWHVRLWPSVGLEYKCWLVDDENGLEVAALGSRRDDAEQIVNDHNQVPRLAAALEWALSHCADPIHNDESEYGRSHAFAAYALAQARK